MILLEIEHELANEKAKTHPNEAVVACLEAMRRAIPEAIRQTQQTRYDNTMNYGSGYTKEGVSPPWWCEL